MAIQVQLRSGTTPENNVFVGALAEVTVDTDQNTLRVHDGVTPGGVTLATNGYVDTAANSVAFIVNGSTNLTAVSSGGNLRANIAGNTVAVISNVGLSVTGTITASNGFVGATQIANGTSTMAVVASGGNIAGNIAGSNVFVIASSGIFVTGIINASSGLTAASLTTGGTMSATGTITTASGVQASGAITGASFSTVGNITSNNVSASAISATGNITGSLVSVSGNIIGSLVSVSGNIIGSLVSVSGNVTCGNVSTSGNVTGNYILGNGALLTGVSTSTATISNGTSNVSVVASGGDVTIGVAGTGNVAVFGNTGATVAGTLTVNSGNAATAIINGGSNATGNIGSSSNYFNTVFATSTSALYADLSEMYQADDNYSPGTVVSFGGSFEITKSVDELDTRIAGVISTNPSYIMNSILDGENVLPVALTGKVPTFVVGPVAKGDMMVSAGNGYAKTNNNPKMGTVIGKALEDFSGDSGIINVVVGRL
jgi:hypothetical protein